MSNIVEYDLIVIGGGPGGYVAAIRAAQLGINVMCIEKRKSFGGTCLNVGCIPSKTLLHSSHLYEQSKNDLVNYGIEINGKVSLNLNKMMANKTDTVGKLTSGIAGLFKKNKVDHFFGEAKFLNNKTIEVNQKKFKADKILIATGSVPSTIPGIDIDEKNIVSSTGALEFEKVPKKLAVIGGGYIGLELGSVWKRLGADVTVIEFSDTHASEVTWGRGEDRGTFTFRSDSDVGMLPLFHMTSDGQMNFQINFLREKELPKQVMRDLIVKMEANFLEN